MARAKRKASYLPPAEPQRGSREACVVCGKQPANAHSLRESARCDWKRKQAAERAARQAEAHR
jgi:hypothetical protein